MAFVKSKLFVPPGVKPKFWVPDGVKAKFMVPNREVEIDAQPITVQHSQLGDQALGVNVDASPIQLHHSQLGSQVVGVGVNASPIQVNHSILAEYGANLCKTPNRFPNPNAWDLDWSTFYLATITPNDAVSPSGATDADLISLPAQGPGPSAIQSTLPKGPNRFDMGFEFWIKRKTVSPVNAVLMVQNTDSPSDGEWFIALDAIGPDWVLMKPGATGVTEVAPFVVGGNGSTNVFFLSNDPNELNEFWVWCAYNDVFGCQSACPTPNIFPEPSDFASWTPFGSPSITSDDTGAPDCTDQADYLFLPPSSGYSYALTGLVPNGFYDISIWVASTGGAGFLRWYNADDTNKGFAFVDMDAIPDRKFTLLEEGVTGVIVSSQFQASATGTMTFGFDGATANVSGWLWCWYGTPQ